MVWSWYISLEVQFFVIASILMLLSKNHPKYTLTLCAAFFISSVLTTMLIRMEIKPKTVLTYEDQLAIFNGLYDQPWIRIGPYLLGMSFGYILYKKECKINITRVVAVLSKLIGFYLCYMICFLL